jgi:hypothetical protein
MQFDVTEDSWPFGFEIVRSVDETTKIKQKSNELLTICAKDN